MAVWTALALLALAAAGADGSSGLLDVLGMEPSKMIEFSAIELPSVDKTGADDPKPCGVSPSKEMSEAMATCVEEATSGGNGKRKRRRMNENVVQKCIFEKLQLVNKAGVPIEAKITSLIDGYGGDADGKEVMKEMTKTCMASIESAPAKKKANVLMSCIKKNMEVACKVHDLKKESPSLALMVAKEAAEQCLENVELPPKMLWSRVRCTAAELKKFADARLSALAPARRRRSPQKGDSKGGKGSTEGKGSKEEEEEEALNESQEKEDDAKESEEDASEGTDDRAERRRKLQERRRAMQAEDVKEARERLEKLVGPLDTAIKAAGDALQETDRCTMEAAGVLDEDGNVDITKLKALLADTTGTSKVKEALEKAADTCVAKDAAAAAFSACVDIELAVTCTAATTADKRQKQASRRAERGRRRQAAQAGRPPKVANPKIPAALKRRP